MLQVEFKWFLWIFSYFCMFGTSSMVGFFVLSLGSLGVSRGVLGDLS